jgi:hypothetical protein
MINDNMTTAAVAIADRPLGAKKKRKDKGRTKFERWSKYLNVLDETEKSIYDFYNKNRNAVIYLRNEKTGALRAIRPRAANE